MRGSSFFLFLILILSPAQTAYPDFFGPSHARHAMSPDGKLLVRINTAKRDEKEDNPVPPKSEVTFYEFNGEKDSYVRRSSFELVGYLSQMLYISNSGKLIFVSLGEKDSIRMYSSEGKIEKTWSLKDFLTESEIEACAMTGSTLQWFEEGQFHDDVFFFHGPSQSIRALRSPFTIMRGINPGISFSASINTKTSELIKHELE